MDVNIHGDLIVIKLFKILLECKYKKDYEALYSKYDYGYKDLMKMLNKEYLNKYFSPNEIKLLHEKVVKYSKYMETYLYGKPYKNDEEKQYYNNLIEYINSNYDSLHKFCVDKKYDYLNTIKYLSSIKDTHESIHYECINHSNNINNKKFNQYKKRIYNLIDIIKNNKINNIVDYYLLLNINPNELLKICINNLNKDDIDILKHFFDKNTSGVTLDKYMIKYIFDKTYFINNTILTIDDKKKIFDFISKHQIPLTDETFKIVKDMYVSEMYLDDNKKNIK